MATAVKCPECSRRYHLTAGLPADRQFCPRCQAPAPADAAHSVAVPGDADDGRPYLVHQAVGEKHCPHCRGVLADTAEVCHLCDRDLRPRVRPKQFTPVDLTYAFGWQPQTRMATLLMFQLLNILALIIVLALGTPQRIGLSGLALTIASQLFVVGSYRATRLTRDVRGRVEIWEVWKIGFVRTHQSSVKWRNCRGIGRTLDAEPSLLDWYMMLMLLGSGVVPGIVWWWTVIRPERIEVTLVGLHGATEYLLHRGTDAEVADDLIRAAAELTELSPAHGWGG